MYGRRCDGALVLKKVIHNWITFFVTFEKFVEYISRGVLMLNKTKLNMTQLINNMKEMGITFKYISEEECIKKFNNFYNFALILSYATNYPIYQKGVN